MKHGFSPPFLLSVLQLPALFANRPAAFKGYITTILQSGHLFSVISSAARHLHTSGPYRSAGYSLK
ncbi:hypothetical protein CLOSTHATH_01163 [Hungatella hathewayi DSM 13479]|uniref:Uncharacterized protein n=1 Tax=Hungatella hathewayi DSM 13479 TaxID=566550 RepID=D3AC34_9FIRM|nr:hypothetical protein CLOSTHATH_01163 [Hungatella hathewayi DSM 13479]